MALPFPGGRVRFADGDTRYPNGTHAWRCAAFGKVGPWTEGWGGFWSLLQEDDGLYADHGRGYSIWCSPACEADLAALGECLAVAAPVTVERRLARAPARSKPLPAPDEGDA